MRLRRNLRQEEPEGGRSVLPALPYRQSTVGDGAEPPQTGAREFRFAVPVTAAATVASRQKVHAVGETTIERCLRCCHPECPAAKYPDRSDDNADKDLRW